MGSRAGARVVQLATAAAAAAVAIPSAPVLIPETLHLQTTTPFLIHTTPLSQMPLPPPQLSHSHSHSSPFTKTPLPTSFPFPGAPFSPATSTTASHSLPQCTSSEYTLAQGATTPILIVSRAPSMVLSTNLIPSSSSFSMALHPSPSFYTTNFTFPDLKPFCFSTSGLYSTPVTNHHLSHHLRNPTNPRNITHPSSPFYSLLQPTIPSHSSRYVEFLLSSLVSLQPSSLFSPQGSQSLHSWHVLKGRELGFGMERGVEDDCLEKRPVLTVVLLGWLGAQQKHLRKYAEWYNARGIHAVTFVIPMADLLSLKGHGNAEQHVDSLARHLGKYLSEEGGVDGEKQLIFHTFSNTGWLTYGAILEKMQKQGEHYVERIKGCVIDSAPVPDPDPQVWASGFSAALLKKRSSATKPGVLKGEVKEGVSMEAANFGSIANLEVGGANGLETAVLSVLEGFFSLFLKVPAINKRLSEVVTVLQKKQPSCPQLYIYSTADKVIPVKAVEAFIEEQRKTGRVVRACNLQTSPHVDHFRSYPQLYSEQLISFLKEVLPSTPAQAYAL